MMMDATNKSVNKTNNTQKALKTSNTTRNGSVYSDYGRSVSTTKQYGSFESKKSASTTPDEVKKARKNERRSRKVAKIKKNLHKLGNQIKETFTYTSSTNGKYCSKKSKNGTFYNDVKWFWDIRKWIPILLVVFIFSIKSVNTKNDVPVFEEPTPEVITAVEEVPTEPVTEETTEPTIPIEEAEVIALARLGDTCARRYSDDVKRIVMWVAINRSEDRANGYGGSLLEEINRPKQWQEYNPNGSYTDSTLAIAKEVYDTWKSGGPRPMYNDMIFFAFNADGTITVRNKFKTDKRTNTMIFGY